MDSVGAWEKEKGGENLICLVTKRSLPSAPPLVVEQLGHCLLLASLFLIDAWNSLDRGGQSNIIVMVRELLS